MRVGAASPDPGQKLVVPGRHYPCAGPGGDAGAHRGRSSPWAAAWLQLKPSVYVIKDIRNPDEWRHLQALCYGASITGWTP